MLTAKQIKSAQDITTEKVMTPEWRSIGMAVEEAFVFVRAWTSGERDNFEASLVQAKKKGAKVNLENMRAKAVAQGTVDENGGRLFKESDIEWLGTKSAAPIDRIFSVIQRLSGMSDQDVEEIAKNLESIPADASTSDSPSSADAQ